MVGLETGSESIVDVGSGLGWLLGLGHPKPGWRLAVGFGLGSEPIVDVVCGLGSEVGSGHEKVGLTLPVPLGVDVGIWLGVGLLLALGQSNPTGHTARVRDVDGAREASRLESVVATCAS